MDVKAAFADSISKLDVPYPDDARLEDKTFDIDASRAMTELKIIDEPFTSGVGA